MSFINPVAKSMNGIKTIETSSITFTDDNSSLNTSAGIVQAQANSTTALNSKINSVDFNTTTGVLTLNKEDGGTLTKDLDGRYLESVGVDDIPNLPASKITEGTLGTARIPALPYVGTTGDETIDDIKTFSSIPKTTATPSANTDLITKGYADNEYLQTGTAQSSTSHTIFGAKTFNSVVKSNGTPSVDTDLITKGYADTEYVNDTTEQTIAGVKTFSSIPKTTATPSVDTDLITKGYADAEYVNDTTAQTIAGVKTFNSVPKTTATPSVNTDLTTKDYVDTAVASNTSQINTHTLEIAIISQILQGLGGGLEFFVGRSLRSSITVSENLRFNTMISSSNVDFADNGGGTGVTAGARFLADADSAGEWLIGFTGANINFNGYYNGLVYFTLGKSGSTAGYIFNQSGSGQSWQNVNGIWTLTIAVNDVVTIRPQNNYPTINNASVTFWGIKLA